MNKRNEGQVQWILIIQIFRVSEFSDLRHCTCDPQVSSHSIFTVICGHAQSSKTFESPNTQVPSWGQSKEMLGFLVPALRLYIRMYPSCGLFSALLLFFPFFINHVKHIRTILSSETKLTEKQALSWLWLLGYSLLTCSRIMVPKGQKDTKCPCNWILTWAMNLIGEIVCPPKRQGSWGSSPPPIPHWWRVATHTHTHTLFWPVLHTVCSAHPGARKRLQTERNETQTSSGNCQWPAGDADEYGWATKCLRAF